MSWRTNRAGKPFPIPKSRLVLYYRVMVTHSPEGYEPYTVEYGMAERSLIEAQKKLERAKSEFPQSQAFIETLQLETY